MSTVIGATPPRVWRALTDPVELAAWDDRIVGAAVSRPERDLASPGARVRWRCRIGSVQIVRDEEVLEAQRERHLRSRLAMGTMRLERCFTLAGEMIPRPQTRLTVTLRTANTVPVFGAVIDRFEVREFATALGDEALRSVRRWCEQPPDAPGSGAQPDRIDPA